jgi:hypothetical protein
MHPEYTDDVARSLPAIGGNAERTDVSPRPPRQLVDCTDYLADEMSQLMSTVYASYTGSRPIDIAI